MVTRSSEPSQTVLVTGATRGLGLAMVERFVERGHVVIGCGRDAERIAELTARHALPHRFHTVDVGDAAEVARWARLLDESHVVPDLVLNNAAIINTNAPLWEVSADEFDAVLRVNISGVANVIRAFAPAMLARGRGVFVNFSSGWGRSTSPEVAPYCATKFAIEGLTQAFAQELPDGMAAVALNPGIINTEMLRSCFGKGAQHYPTAEEWSRTAVPFLLSLTPRHNGRSLDIA